MRKFVMSVGTSVLFVLIFHLCAYAQLEPLFIAGYQGEELFMFLGNNIEYIKSGEDAGCIKTKGLTNNNAEVASKYVNYSVEMSIKRTANVPINLILRRGIGEGGCNIVIDSTAEENVTRIWLGINHRDIISANDIAEYSGELFPVNEWRVLRIVMKDNRFYVYVDGEKKAALTDSGYTDYKTGGFSLNYTGHVVRYINFYQIDDNSALQALKITYEDNVFNVIEDSEPAQGVRLEGDDIYITLPKELRDTEISKLSAEPVLQSRNAVWSIIDNNKILVITEGGEERIYVLHFQDLVIGEPDFAVERSNFNSTKTIRVSVPVYRLDGEEVIMYLVLYDGNKMLASSYDAAGGEASEEYDTLEVTLEDVPDNLTNERVRVFLWDSLINMTALTQPIEPK